MITRADIVSEARSWDGTPFHWQQAVKGVGCDCKGLVAGVARALGMSEGDSIYAGMMADRSRRVDVRLLRQGLAELFDPARDPRPGDVLLLRIGSKPQHLAILTDLPGRMIHTNGSINRVQEVRMGSVWWSRTGPFGFDSAWGWRGIA